MRALCVLLCTIFMAGAPSAAAGSIMDFIRSYDLNDYSLGLAVSTRDSPFIGGNNATIAYPYLTSFTNSAFTDNWLLIRDGGYGIRIVTDKKWELGVIGRVRTLGLGNSDAEELIGVADRKWTLELGPTIGYRAWPVHITWTTYGEITNRHDGFESDLAFSLPIEFDRGFIIPTIKAVYLSDDYANYYYAVTAAEATPNRPEYKPGAAVNAVAKLRVGYAIADKWLLAATLGVDFLASEIRNSPIVDKDRILFGTIGLAYNADVFNPTAFDDARALPDFDIRVGAFQSNIDSRLKRDTADGVPGSEIDLENVLGAPDDETVLQLDATWHIGQHHRLEFGYFELTRDGQTMLENALAFGDEVYAAGTDLDSRFDYSSLRVGYTFFLMRDGQKELGVMGGIHFAEFSADIAASATGQAERSSTNTPLPVIGVNGAAFFGDRTTVRARIHGFASDFDQHEGWLLHAAIDLERRFGDSFSAGLGYNFYGMRLSSSDDSLNGRLETRHHGPVVFLSLGF